MKKTLSNPALCQQLDKSSWLWTPPGSTRKKYEPHDFPGYGSYDVNTTPNKSDMELIDNSIETKEQEEKKLGELEATAISGNGASLNSQLRHFATLTRTDATNIIFTHFVCPDPFNTLSPLHIAFQIF